MASISLDERNVIEWLSDYTDLFKDVMNTLSIPPSVGLGVIPKLHHNGAPCCLSRITNIDEELYCAVRAPVTGYNNKNCIINITGRPERIYAIHLPRDEYERFIIQPEFSLEVAYVVSLYQFKLGTESLDEELFNCPEKVIAGFFAHEGGHWLRNHGQGKVFGTRSFNDPVIQELMQHPQMLQDEILVDILAARKGFKNEILSCIDYIIADLESLNLTPDLQAKFGPIEEHIKSHQIEKEFINKFA